MRFRQMINSGLHRAEVALREAWGDMRLLVDPAQLNRCGRTAWRTGRKSRACYLLIDHQRRRLARRREIRRLVGR